jgi:hypothetical protein
MCFRGNQEIAQGSGKISDAGGRDCGYNVGIYMKRYMVIEHFAPGAKEKVYERFQKKGRILPLGLIYIDSWLEKEGERCFQLMETTDPSLFDPWIDAWKDLVRFEIIELGEKPEAR